MKKQSVETLKEEYTRKYNEGINKSGVFWAFSNEQFEENRTHKRKTLKNNSAMFKNYLSIGCGGYIHKLDKPKLDNFLTNIAPKLKQEFVKNVDRNDYILYELINHECFYTHCIEDAYNILKSYFADITEEEIGEIYYKHLEKQEQF